jgi:hypothetical protein
MPKKIDITNHRYGKLIVIREFGKKWECLCDCGKTTFVSSRHLRRTSEPTRSCGCEGSRNKIGLNSLTHGEANKSKEYRAWCQIKNRCYNSNVPEYKYYGARGIFIAEQWINSYPQFLKDMGRCPPGHTIERMDNNKSYIPGNCKWASRKEQAHNRRNSVKILVNGEERLLCEVAEESNIKYATAYCRNMRHKQQ